MNNLNPKIIKIVIDHFFSNTSNIVEDELILNFYNTLSNYITDDPSISWEEIGPEYLVWFPFEIVNPCDVLENMDNLYDNIQKNFVNNSSNFNINPLELALEIAHATVVDYFTEELGENFEYTIEETGDTFYTEDAQEVFNSEYDFFLQIINQIKHGN